MPELTRFGVVLVLACLAAAPASQPAGQIIVPLDDGRGELVITPDPARLAAMRCTIDQLRAALGQVSRMATLETRPMTFESPDAMAHLDRRLFSKDSEAAARAADEPAMLRGRARHLVPLLVRRLTAADETRDDVFAVLNALSSIGANAADAIPAIATRAHSDNRDIQIAAIDTLGLVGAVAELQKLLQDGAEPGVRQAAAEALAAGHIDLIHKALSDPKPPVRAAAAAAMRLRRDYSDEAALLVPLLSDDDKAVRMSAEHTLAAFRPVAPAIPALSRLLDKADRDEQAAVVVTLAAFRADAAILLPRLKAMWPNGTTEADKMLRCAIVCSAASYGSQIAADFAPLAAQCLADTDSGRLASALWAIVDLGPKAAVLAMKNATDLVAHEDEHVAAGAMFILATVGREAAPGVDMLRRQLAEPRAERTHAGLRALAAIGPAAKPALPEMARLVSADYDDPIQLLHWMASIDLDESTRLLKELAAKLPKPRADGPEVASRVAEGIAELERIRAEIASAKEAVTRPSALPFRMLSRYSADPANYQATIRPGDDIAGIIALLGAPTTAGGGAMRFLVHPSEKSLPAWVDMHVRDGRVESIKPGGAATWPTTWPSH